MAFSIDFQQPVFLNVPWDRITALKNYGEAFKTLVTNEVLALLNDFRFRNYMDF